MQWTVLRARTSQEIGDAIESAVRNGRLSAGEPVPSVRSLAADLSVSPATVAAAYRDLRLRGVLASEPGRLTRVAPRPVRPAPRAVGTSRTVGRDLSSGNPNPDLLPDLADALGRLPLPRVLYGAPMVDPELGEMILTNFAEIQVPIGPEQTTVVSGVFDGIERVLSTNLLPNDRIAVEDPCYTGLLDLGRSCRLTMVPVEIDDYGLVTHDLERVLNSGVKACVLTPRAQNPRGSAMDPERAARLRELFAAHPDVLVIENDHANAVAGVEYSGVAASCPRWAVMRSVSKMLGPDLRLAFMAGDAVTVDRVNRKIEAGAGWVSHILQRCAVALLNDPAVQELIDTARMTYLSTREGLMTALADRGLSAHGRSGINVFVPVREETQVIRGMDELGWFLRAGEPHRLGSAPFVRITIADLAGHEIDPLADALAAVVGSRVSYSA